MGFFSRKKQITGAAAADDVRLQRLRGIIGSVPEGRALLAAFDALDIPVLFDPKVPTYGGSGKTKAVVRINRGTGETIDIRLNPALPDRTLVASLIHEIRHTHQFTYLRHTDIESLTPDGQVIFTRMAEGDAFAFTAGLIHDINKATGLKLKTSYARERNFFRRLFHKKPAGSLAVMRDAFIRFQKSGGARGYDKMSVRLIAEDSMAGATRRRGQLADVFNHAAAVFCHGADHQPIHYMGARTTRELMLAVARHVPQYVYRDALTAASLKPAPQTAIKTPAP